MDRKTDQQLPRARDQEGGKETDCPWRLPHFRMMQMFYILIVAVLHNYIPLPKLKYTLKKSEFYNM